MPYIIFKKNIVKEKLKVVEEKSNRAIIKLNLVYF